MLNFKAINEKSEFLSDLPMFIGSGGGMDYYQVHANKDIRVGVKVDMEPCLTGTRGIVRVRVIKAEGKDILNVSKFFNDNLQEKLNKLKGIKGKVTQRQHSTRVSWIQNDIPTFESTIGQYDPTQHDEMMKAFDKAFDDSFENVGAIIKHLWGAAAYKKARMVLEAVRDAAKPPKGGHEPEQSGEKVVKGDFGKKS